MDMSEPEGKVWPSNSMSQTSDSALLRAETLGLGLLDTARLFEDFAPDGELEM